MREILALIFRWITLRRVVQTFLFLLFVWLIVRTTYIFEGESPIIPRDLFLRADPLAGGITAIASRSLDVLPRFALALALTVGAILLGRFFCNWICPLGTTLDIVDRLIRPKSRRAKLVGVIERHPRLRNIKYYLLIFVLAAAIFSTQLSWLIDPISITVRSYAIIIYPYFSKFIDQTIGQLHDVPLINRITEPIYGYLRFNFLPEEQPVFNAQFAFFLFFVGILVLVRLQPRFWCRNLCPLGAFFGMCSRLSVLRRVVDAEKCIDCGRCQRECRMGAITEDPRGYLSQECSECLTCQAVCPVKAVSFKFASPFGRSVKQYAPEGLGTSRRTFLKSAAVGAIALPAVKLKAQDKNFNPSLIRPPGSLPEEEFLDKCIRCGECMKACPTNALQPAILQGGVEAFGTPILVPKIGYCEFECNTCAQVCPTGAIQELSMKEKQKFKMGTAYFNKNKCYPWNEHINCLVCEEHCPVPEKAIRFWETEVFEQETNRLVKVKLPYVITEMCIGCGICENKCPIAESPGIRVTAREEQRHRDRYTGNRGLF